MKDVILYVAGHCKGFTCPRMGTVLDIQSHIPFDTPTQGDINIIQVPVDTRIIVFSGDIKFM